MPGYFFFEMSFEELSILIKKKFFIIKCNNWCRISIVDADGLVLQHQGISSNNIDLHLFTPKRISSVLWVNEGKASKFCDAI